jgi:predicted ATPase/DNA-binding SARP family transcriptional activator
VLEYRVLGPLEVERDGVEVPLSAAKLRSALLVLLLSANRVVSADHLIDAIWGANVPGSAKKLVQVYVSQLRGALGPDAIETAPQGYRMSVGSSSLDSVRFEQMRGDASRALADGNAELALALARRALGLWRGPALVDVAYQPFASTDAARLDELRLECREDELDAELALGRHEEVVPELRRLCTEHPLRERARARLALALYRCSRQSEALEVLAAGRKAMVEELGVEPGKDHQDLERAILNQDASLEMPSVGPATSRHLPSSSSTLVGREAELAQLHTLVARDDVRLLTISGAGGSGKTRVALELARSAGPSFANGAAFIELAPVQDPNLVLGTIARALSVPEMPEETPGAALGRWAQGRDMLLVLDNFEHLIGAARDLAELVEATARLTVVVTSRRVLHLSGEHVFPLSPLPLDDAVELFCDRAAARGSLPTEPPGPADPATRRTIEAICRRLDCLPLALELAAARTSTLTPELLLERLSDRVAVLGVGPRDAPARQQTLNDTLRWSTDLLSFEERRVLACLSTFVGGSAIEAAEVVCATDLERLSALIDSSLLQRTAAGGEVRLSMLETIREYAAELLGADGDRTVTEARHASYFRDLTEAAAVSGPVNQAQKVQVLDADIDNLRAAIERSELAGDDDTALRVATGLYRFYYLRGLFREGRDRIAGPLQRGAGDPGLQALALRALAGFHFLLGELDEARVVALRGIEVATGAGADYAVMACHTVLSHVARERGEFAEAMSHLESSAAIAEELGLAEDVVVANTNLGELALALGDLDEARRRWELSLAFYDEEDEARTFSLLGLGSVAVRQGHLEEAADHFIRARTMSERAGWPHNTTMALVGLAGVVSEQGEHAEAARLLGRADALLEATGGELVVADEEIYQDVRTAALADLGDDQFAELLAAGASGPAGP